MLYCKIPLVSKSNSMLSYDFDILIRYSYDIVMLWTHFSNYWPFVRNLQAIGGFPAQKYNNEKMDVCRQREQAVDQTAEVMWYAMMLTLCHCDVVWCYRTYKATAVCLEKKRMTCFKFGKYCN